MIGPRAVPLALLALCGCFDSGLVQCPDGTVCGEGRICAEGGRCVEPDPCNGVDPGTACDSVTVEDGICISGTCIEIVCGDSLTLDEECDDGNVMSHDACSSGCRREQAVWTSLAPEGDMFRNRQPQIVYDSRRGLVWLFGSTLLEPADLWRWDGVSWVDATPPAGSPDPRHGHVMVYDAARDRVVLFGGLNGGVALADTWEWDGSAWADVTVPGSPSPRLGAAMAYDIARARAVLFGGLSDTEVPTGDTWEWDGSDWRDVTPTDGPTARSEAAMAYDWSRQRTVLFGGLAIGVGAIGDTWEWDGTTWTEITPAAAPRARYRHDMAYDAIRRRVVLFGGEEDQSRLVDTWEWDGESWTQVAAPGPGPRFRDGMAYDSAHAGMLLIGGGHDDDDETFWELRYSSETEDDDCRAARDTDRDGLAGCADPDCWPYCEPICPPGAPCDPAAPRCGDGDCNSFLETTAMCPEDCP